MGTYRVRVNGREVEATVTRKSATSISFLVGGRSYDVAIEPAVAISRPAAGVPASAPPRSAATAQKPHPAGAGEIRSPMPGIVLRIPVKVDSKVKAGDTVAVIEAMKMENNIAATHDGVVGAVLVKEGAEVDAHQTLIRIAI